MKTLGIYIHIPFCLQKCLYCDFLSFPEGRGQQALYFDALKKEIELGAKECEGYVVSSVFFGGGTPTSVEAWHIIGIMSLLKEKFAFLDNAEITIECNPGTATLDALVAYRQSGINRISIGLQSANDDELKRLGRIHNLEQFNECYQNARKAGFDNINVDLMSALPGQSLGDYERNLNYVCALNPIPEHISAYSLIIEEGTPFYDMYGEEDNIVSDGAYGKNDKEDNASSENFSCKNGAHVTKYPDAEPLPLPDEDTEREMYHKTKEILRLNGYHRYEISNYVLSKEKKENLGSSSYECIHNKRYWQGGDYIGFGLGAASYMKNVRYHNTSDFHAYLNALNEEKEPCLNVIRKDAEELDKKAQMEEFMFLGLRMCCGVSCLDFAGRFGEEIETVYGDIIRELINDKLMEKEKGRLFLTDKGLDVSNYCMAKFLL